MSVQDWKKNVNFVLVEPRESGNIGASARAIKNMGFRNLSMVNPPQPIGDEARWLARGALDVLDAAHAYPSLDEALADKAMVVGATRRTGRNRGLIVSAEEGVRRLSEGARTNKVALLFGREDRGLYNEEISRCGFLIHISAHRTQPSLNLAQAVLLVAYELARSGRRSTVPEDNTACPTAVLVSHQELTFLYERVTNALRLLDYVPRGNRNLEGKIMQNLRHLIGRAGLTAWELNMLHGICAQVERKLAHHVAEYTGENDDIA